MWDASVVWELGFDWDIKQHSEVKRHVVQNAAAKAAVYSSHHGCNGPNMQRTFFLSHHINYQSNGGG